MVRGLMRSDCVRITDCGCSAAILVVAKTGLRLGDRECGGLASWWLEMLHEAGQRFSMCVWCIASKHATACPSLLKTENLADTQR